ncbi:hypothetical protein [Spiroplasma eriocheiris]|uniref:Transmembrane protein n=1 Tax=Spiroplasma eriocheiris TaxID=315358 RepID=A0A0H3XJ56_9MOLU|nr:hypothetical protein [Spiroplasma eriocheiris]AHF57390.1 hypothetical protein SPE_0259 [Spiroplasma eriocheiris CCTCC M 207170]AKM53846.1 hypothetical protein SERIO_v1c02620 [Spiroplasma eriocheiris]
MVRELEVFKYFIGTNLCLIFFSTAVVAMFYWKNFQISRKAPTILKSKFYYVIYFSLPIIIILPIVEIILLFTTSNFYFISNPPLTWSYSSRFICHLLLTIISGLLFCGFCGIWYFNRWKLMLYFTNDTLGNFFDQIDRVSLNANVIKYHEELIFKFNNQFIQYHQNNPFSSSLLKILNLTITLEQDPIVLHKVNFLRINKYSFAKINSQKNDVNFITKVYAALMWKQLINWIILFFSFINLLLIIFIFVAGIVQWSPKLWDFYHYSQQKYVLVRNNIIYIFAVIIVSFNFLVLTGLGIKLFINIYSQNWKNLLFNITKIIYSVIIISLSLYFLTSLINFVDYFNAKISNSNVVAPINVNDLLIWLNQDYIKGMGIIILLQIIFTSYIIGNLTYELIINFQAQQIAKKLLINHHYWGFLSKVKKS